jgi:hypothetical protein
MDAVRNILIPTVFTTQICQLPSVILMSIAATRMYRSLPDFKDDLL